MTDQKREITASARRIAEQDALASESGLDPFAAHMALDLAHGDRGAARLILEVVQLAEPREVSEHWHSVALTVAWELHRLTSSCCGKHRPSPAKAAGFVQRQFAILDAREQRRPSWLTRLFSRSIR